VIRREYNRYQLRELAFKRTPNHNESKDLKMIDGLIWTILIGIAAGWLSGKIMKGGGFGLVGNLVVGILGAVIGGFLFRALGVYTVGIIGNLISATVGALVLLTGIGLATQKK
jgi:uncharacterized membrane protein YeaQ/YmgE (transglycosylase-associated protein family)